MKNKFYKVDLHIHSPSSRDYKGIKNEEEYLKIIKKAKVENLKIIAFTDHNSIEGYKKIKNIKEKLENNFKKSRIKRDKSKLMIFKNILILPGLEFEVSNCVHFLVIFDDRTSIKEIEDFLRRGGYNEGDFGYEIPNQLSNWDIPDFFNELKKFNCIVICSHIDSNKGVYNVIPQNKLRAKCLSSERLNAVEYNSEVTKDKIISIIKTSKEYRRKNPIAFVKFSDSHNINEIGRNATFINLETIDFNSLKKAFDNPTEKVSTEYPEIQKILDKLIHKEISFGIEDFSEQNKVYFKKLICALNNTDGGYCLFGITKNKNILGLPCDLNSREEIENKMKIYIENIFNCKRDIDGDVYLEPGIYQLQTGKIIISLQIRKSDDFININNDGNIYVIKDGKLHTLPPRKFQEIIESKSLSLIDARVQKKIEKFETEINLLRNFMRAVPIIKRFEAGSINLTRIIDKPDILEDIKLKKHEIIRKNNLRDKYPNGNSDGDVIFFEHKIEPRLDYTYLRYSPPIFRLKLNKKPLKKETIYIVPGGAIFYGLKRHSVFTHRTGIAIAFHSRITDRYSNKFITSFLKSSFWLWYCMNKFDTCDIFPVELFEKVIIPKINMQDPINKGKVSLIENNVNKIIKLEREILISSLRKKRNKKDTEKHLKRITIHNQKVDTLAYEIDKSIYSLLNLTDTEIKIIESFLKYNKIYLPIKS